MGGALSGANGCGSAPQDGVGRCARRRVDPAIAGAHDRPVLVLTQHSGDALGFRWPTAAHRDGGPDETGAGSKSKTRAAQRAATEGETTTSTDDSDELMMEIIPISFVAEYLKVQIGALR